MQLHKNIYIHGLNWLICNPITSFYLLCKNQISIDVYLVVKLEICCVFKHETANKLQYHAPTQFLRIYWVKDFKVMLCCCRQ